MSLLTAVSLIATTLPAVSATNLQDVQATSEPRLRFRIAVNQGKWEQLRFEGRSFEDRDLIRGLQAMIIDKLIKTGWFEVLDREATVREGVLDEKQIDAERRRELELKGREVLSRSTIVGADYMITPELLEFAATSKKGGGVRLGPLDTRKTESVCKVNLAMRISSVETTSIIASATGIAEKKQAGGNLGIDFGGAGFSSETWASGLASKAFEEAISTAVDSLVQEFAKFPWQAIVAQVTEKTGQIVINKGMSAGVREGMVFDVMELGEPVIDPATGNQIAPGEETKIASVKVTRVLPAAAFCEIVSGNALTIERGDLVRLPKK